MNDIIYCCAECGSTDIMERDWVDVNTKEVVGDPTDSIEDRWCADCSKHVDFIIKSDNPNKNKFSKDAK